MIKVPKRLSIKCESVSAAFVSTHCQTHLRQLPTLKLWRYYSLSPSNDTGFIRFLWLSNGLVKTTKTTIWKTRYAIYGLADSPSLWNSQLHRQLFGLRPTIKYIFLTAPISATPYSSCIGRWFTLRCTIRNGTQFVWNDAESESWTENMCWNQEIHWY